MGTIRDKMTADLDLRGFAATTKKEYLQRAQNFVAYHQRPPTELGEQEIREFLLYLVNEKKTGSATQHMYIAAIKFLYATTLARPDVVANIPWPKRSQILPDILTGEEVERLFQQIASGRRFRYPISSMTKTSTLASRLSRRRVERWAMDAYISSNRSLKVLEERQQRSPARYFPTAER